MSFDHSGLVNLRKIRKPDCRKEIKREIQTANEWLFQSLIKPIDIVFLSRGSIIITAKNHANQIFRIALLPEDRRFPERQAEKRLYKLYYENRNLIVDKQALLSLKPSFWIRGRFDRFESEFYSNKLQAVYFDNLPICKENK